jgi:REP element-mobilizing transposase RayT
LAIELSLGGTSMPFVRIWLHLVWSTKEREPLLQKEIRKTLFNHIRANANAKGIHLECIDGYVDHAHALVLLKSDMTVAQLLQLLKGESSHWANEQKLLRGKFEWQDEYFAISVSESDVDAVRAYISSQEEHHQKRSFAEEYQDFLKQYRLNDGG